MSTEPAGSDEGEADEPQANQVNPSEARQDRWKSGKRKTRRNAKAKQAATKARLPRGRKPSHANMPTEGVEAAEYVRDAFVKTSAKLQAAHARQRAEINDPTGAVAKRKAGHLFSLTQLDEAVIARIEVEYRAGLKSISLIAAGEQVSDTTVYKLAAKRGWPSRAASRMAALDLIRDQDMKDTVAKLRQSTGINPEAAQARLDEVLAHDPGAQVKDPVSIDAVYGTVDEAKTDLLIEDYAMAVAQVLSVHRGLADKALKVGSEILATYDQLIRWTNERHSHDPKKAAAEVSKLVGPYATLVRSLKEATNLQRQAYSVGDDEGRGLWMGKGRPEAGKEGEAMPPQGDTPPLVGSYEALVREAEARGIALNG